MRKGTQAAVRSEGDKCLSKKKDTERNNASANNNLSLSNRRGTEKEDVIERETSDKQALRKHDRKRRTKQHSCTIKRNEHQCHK